MSPDAKWDVVLFQRDCGATTDFSTQISLLPLGGVPNGAGNVFIADAGHGAARAGAWGGPWAEIKWIAPNELIVRYASESRLFKQTENISGVRVRYQAAVR
jgi:hypothetical protein